jgi:threonine aldolase
MSQPQRSFASDNNSGASPEVIAAIAAANVGHAVGYGDDAWTRRAENLFKEEFGGGAGTFLVFNGTGANVLALSLACRPGSAVLCAHDAHIAVDEAGAPEAAGVKTAVLPSAEGKIGPEVLKEALEAGHDFHRARPACVSISQPTELGAVYTREEIAALAEISHRAGLPLHMDGARIANAAVALGLPFRAFTTEVGVDLLSFGGTKNGLLYGEALVVLDKALARDLPGLRKTRLQLASKMRFIAAQYEAYLGQGLWKRNAANANLMATRLAGMVSGLEGVRLVNRVETNALFAEMPAKAAEELRKSYFFYDWEGGLVRWMTSFDTTPDDLGGFVAALRSALGEGVRHG